MKTLNKFVFQLFGLVLLSASAISAQQVQRSPFDVKNYQMDVALTPSENKLNATVDVNFVPLEDTRSVTFELNGSLKVESISRVNASAVPAPAVVSAPKTRNVKPAATPQSQSQVTFIQDQVGVSDLGPSVKVDLGETVTKGTPVTLRFKYSGILVTPSGGPLLTKRLAYVGNNDGYLMYAARWFPFHEYAADQATSDISISLPAGFNVVGYSDSPVSNAGGKHRFVRTKENLVGNIAYGKYINKNLRFGDYELQ
ncbi:MAG: Aminopeptidase, partial [Acidobacteria bacterium]|nr:Aminopeptidase [Acidobacteriota bacterium]